MKFFEATAIIQASPQTIWAILADGPNWSAWDSGVIRVEGRLAPGETIKIVSSANPGRTFPLKVTEFIPEQRMVFSGGMPVGLFKGVRTYTLSPHPDGGTAFRMREEYSGPMVPVMWRSMPDLNPSFQQFAKGLKSKAETGR